MLFIRDSILASNNDRLHIVIDLTDHFRTFNKHTIPAQISYSAPGSQPASTIYSDIDRNMDTFANTMLHNRSLIFQHDEGSVYLVVSSAESLRLSAAGNSISRIHSDFSRAVQGSLASCQLPSHLQRMALFKVNTGRRKSEVCGLRWDWKIRVPELDTSVFLIPEKQVKNRVEAANRVSDEKSRKHTNMQLSTRRDSIY